MPLSFSAPPRSSSSAPELARLAIGTGIAAPVSDFLPEIPMRSPLPHTISPLVAGVIIAVASVVHAATLGAQHDQHAQHEQKKTLEWGPAPAIFPAGARMAVERGDPSAAGEFVVRLSFPDGYRIPPHFHPAAEHGRVVRGTFLVGMGDTLVVDAARTLAPGDSISLPARMPHFAIARGATEVSVRSQGPFKMTYVNPADTPKQP